MKMGFRELLACSFAFFMCVESHANAEAVHKKLPGLELAIQTSKAECHVRPATAKVKSLKICQTRYDVEILNKSSNPIPVDFLCGSLGSKMKFKPARHFEAAPNGKVHLPVIATRFPDLEVGHPVRKTSCLLRAGGKNLVIF